MLKILSNALSAPVIAAAVAVIFSFYSPNMFLSAILGILFLSIIPVMPFLYFYSKGLVDIDINERKYRTFFLLFAIVVYIMSSAIFFYLNYHEMLLISLAYVFVTTSIMLATLFWKISIHSAGVACPTTALVYFFGKEIIFLYILTAIVIFVRFKLKVHTLSQLIAGSAAAIVVTFLTYFFFY